MLWAGACCCCAGSMAYGTQVEQPAQATELVPWESLRGAEAVALDQDSPTIAPELSRLVPWSRVCLSNLRLRSGARLPVRNLLSLEKGM